MPCIFGDLIFFIFLHSPFLCTSKLKILSVMCAPSLWLMYWQMAVLHQGICNVVKHKNNKDSATVGFDHGAATMCLLFPCVEYLPRFGFAEKIGDREWDVNFVVVCWIMHLIQFPSPQKAVMTMGHDRVPLHVWMNHVPCCFQCLSYIIWISFVFSGAEI